MVLDKTTRYFSLQVPTQEVLYENLKKINVVDVKELSKFLHNIIDKLSGKLITPQTTSITNEKDRKDLVDIYIFFINKVVGRELKKENIIEDLTVAEVLSQHITIITDTILSRFQDIKKELTEKLTAISSNYLSDFDWKLNQILSSDHINIVQENTLFLNLTIKQNQNDSKQLLIELSKKELDHLLETFETINNTVQSLKI
ncbi:COMM domain-containing protein 8 [Tieghemostelium lacteum]|uniref:COMM domain-containing protein 8 n=1 Tax=Tieghemostelium lacteum TaxID=361077 RepID=A0A151ZEH0_TIELA|nr:COMM domain-containing protein 8 [Tieghemostelium lacteum]|eukprot:KYQ92353.1 COMM domain-containing protein 8 [Tieghemostelium lacteum]